MVLGELAEGELLLGELLQGELAQGDSGFKPPHSPIRGRGDVDGPPMGLASSISPGVFNIFRGLWKPFPPSKLPPGR